MRERESCVKDSDGTSARASAGSGLTGRSRTVVSREVALATRNARPTMNRITQQSTPIKQPTPPTVAASVNWAANPSPEGGSPTCSEAGASAAKAASITDTCSELSGASRWLPPSQAPAVKSTARPTAVMILVISRSLLAGLYGRARRGRIMSKRLYQRRRNTGSLSHKPFGRDAPAENNRSRDVRTAPHRGVL